MVGRYLHEREILAISPLYSDKWRTHGLENVTLRYRVFRISGLELEHNIRLILMIAVMNQSRLFKRVAY
jgi:hypothetical protein